MMTSLQDQITADFKLIPQSIDTILAQVTQLESGVQPVSASDEQSLTSTTRPPEQSLGHEADSSTTQSCREIQPAQEVPMDTSVQSRTDHLPWDKLPANDPPDYEEIIFWSPVESNSEMGELSRVLDSTSRSIQENTPQWKMRRKHPAPDSVHTKCPRLDLAIKSKLPKQAKDVDTNLACLQAQVLDMANLLMSSKQ